MTRTALMTLAAAVLASSTVPDHAAAQTKAENAAAVLNGVGNLIGGIQAGRRARERQQLEAQLLGQLIHTQANRPIVNIHPQPHYPRPFTTPPVYPHYPSQPYPGHGYPGHGYPGHGYAGHGYPQAQTLPAPYGTYGGQPGSSRPGYASPAGPSVQTVGYRSVSTPRRSRVVYRGR